MKTRHWDFYMKHDQRLFFSAHFIAAGLEGNLIVVINCWCEYIQLQ